MGFDGSKRLTQGQIAALETRVVQDVESGLAGGVYERIAALEEAMPITSIDSYTKLKQIVAAGNASTAVVVADQLEEDWTDELNDTTYTVAHDVCHISASETFSDDGGTTEVTSPGLFLQWHYATPYGMPYSSRQALYTVPAGGLQAGIYYFRVTGIQSGWGSAGNNNKTFMFELTDDLTQGQKIMLSATKDTADFTAAYVRIYDSAYAAKRNANFGTDGNVPLSIWDEESGSPLSGDDSSEDAYSTGTAPLNHIQRVLLGYNRWSQSAIRQWLNSDAPCRVEGDEVNYPGWWTPKNDFDLIPLWAITYDDGNTISYGKPGFLSGYSTDFKNALRPVKIQNKCNTVTDGEATEYTYDKVFLPSLNQMNIQQNPTEGSVFDYYKQLFAANPVSGRTNWAQGGSYSVLTEHGIDATATKVAVFLRSPYRSSPAVVFAIENSGHITNITSAGAANISTNRVRPVFCIG